MTFTGPGVALGQNLPSPWEAQEIVYYHLTLANSGSGMRFSLLTDSGQKLGSDIDGFIEEVLTGSPVTVPFSHPQTPPDVTVARPCFVVVELDEALGWNFLPGAPAIKTQDDHAADYCALMHVDTAGGITPNQAPTSPPCKVLYFAAIAPKPAQDHVSDAFNYYVQFEQIPGQSITLVIDPAIKNDGHGGGV
jgi:hypothetical protein